MLPLKWCPVNWKWAGKIRCMLPMMLTDIKQVAAATADGAFYNNGQSCCSVERIYVHESVSMMNI